MIRKILAIGLLILLCTGCPMDNDGDDGGGDTPEENYASAPEVRVSAVELGVGVVTNDSETGSSR